MVQAFRDVRCWHGEAFGDGIDVRVVGVRVVPGVQEFNECGDVRGIVFRERDEFLGGFPEPAVERGLEEWELAENRFVGVEFDFLWADEEGCGGAREIPIVTSATIVGQWGMVRSPAECRVGDWSSWLGGPGFV